MKINNKGFTIVELIIATAVFSGILTVIMSAFLFISHEYIKGSINAETQATARNILKEISQKISLSNSSAVYAGDLPHKQPLYCIGDTMYYANLDNIVDKNKVPQTLGLASLNSSICSATVVLNSANTKELLANNMRVGDLSISPIPGTNLWTVSLTIGYGTELTTNGASPPYNYSCPSGLFSGTYCTVVTLSTTIQQRTAGVE